MKHKISIRFDRHAIGNFAIAQHIRKCITAALSAEKVPLPCEINVLVTDDQGIREINNAYRQIDRATDVLSFPMNEFRHPLDFQQIEQEEDCFHPESGELLLGDIVISKEHVFAQAEEYGHSVKREFAFLIAHSMLHLFGYDHMEEEERLQMERMQEEILERMHITREADTF